MRTPRFIQLHHENSEMVRAELAAGLLARPASIAPKFFYDALGSRLFDAITELPEYYPTRTERAIFDAHLPSIARAIGAGRTLVDLGAGNGAKAARLFPALAPRRYIAVDISVDYLRDALEHLQGHHPEVEMWGVGIDFSVDLSLPRQLDEGDGPGRLLFYPGSSIGNFSPAAALDFLRQARQVCRGGGLLVGVDLVKPRTVLEAAYDDALQVTAAFNRNLLRRVNALLGADADIADFKHLAFYDKRHSRIEMHLEARRDVCIRWAGGERRFDAGETILTEHSCKYTPQRFEALLRDAGFKRTRCWSDEQGWFALFWAEA